MSRSRKLLIAAATAVTACVAAASPSQAAESANNATTGKATVVCQLADPTLATPAILADPAATKALCQKNGIAGSGPYAGGIQPFNEVNGSCGDSYLYLSDRHNGGNPEFIYGVDSSKGPIIAGSVTVWWQNLRTGTANHFGDNPTGGGTSWNEINTDEWTGTGAVYTTMTGSVEVGSGLVCTLLVPTDTESIN
jgi:hypothetical protein